MRVRLPPTLICLILLLTAACSREAAKKRHLASGEAFLAAHQAPQAIIELLNAVSEDPLWGEARFKLAEAYAANDDPENAFRQYVRAADLMPDATEAQLKASTYMLVAGQFEDARTRARRLLEKDPKNVDALIVLGNALAGLRDPEAAVAQLNEAIELDPGRSQTYSNLALLQAGQGHFGSANVAFEKAVQTAPTSIEARLALASFQWATGDVEATRTSLQLAYDMQPSHLVTSRALAVFYRATGESAEAEKHLIFVASAVTLPGAKFELADYYIAEGRLDEARRILEPLRTQAVAAAEAETRLAGLAYQAGQRADGHEILDRLLARAPNSTLALLLKARWLMNEGHVEQGLERARAAATASPRMVAAHYIRGLAELRSHRTSDAIKSFTEVLRLNPRAAAAQVQLSYLHLMRNNLDSAVLLADEAIRNAPTNLDAYLARIRAWAARGDIARARLQLASIKKQVPGFAAVHALEGLTELRAGDARAARIAFERALAIDSQWMEALQGITTLDMVQGNVAQARRRVEVGLANGVETPAMLLMAAKVFAADRNFAQAESLLRKSIASDPLDTANYALLGRVFQEQNRLEVVRAEFDDAAAAGPHDLSSRMMSAMIVHTQGDLEGAKRRYEGILRLEPRAALAANNLAAIYADSGENLDVARQLAESAVDQSPASAEFQDTLGWVYYQRQLNGQALARFQLSVAAEPANPVYHYHLGLAHLRNSDRERARVAFQRALALNPSYPDARQALAGLAD